MNEVRPKSVVNRLKDGVRLVAILLASAAVLRLLARAMKLPLSDWLAAILNAYTALLHPIVEYTIGLVPAIFGYALLPVAKDIIILYVLIGGSLYRSFPPPPSPATAKLRVAGVLLGAFWPYVLPQIVKDAKAYYLDGVRNFGSEVLGRDSLLRFLRELAFVLAVVALSMLLNAAGVIGLPSDP